MGIESERLQTAIQEISGFAVVKAAGEIDMYTAPSFRGAVHQAIDKTPGSLVIDLSDVGYMDSSGFGTLLGAIKRVKADGGFVRVAGCSEAIERLIRITGLDGSIELFDTVDEAVTA